MLTLLFFNKFRCAETDDNKDELVNLDELWTDIQNDQSAKRLGLEFSKWDLTYRLSHFVGAVWLRKPAGEKPGVVLAVQPKISDLNAVRMEGGNIGFRPDYYLPEDEGVIVDAKYKSIIDSAMPEERNLISLSGLQFAKGVQPGNADVHQVIAYCDLLAVINPNSTFKIAVLIAPGAPQCEIPDRFDWNEFIGRGATLDLGKRRIIVLPCPVPKRQAILSDNY